MTQLRFGASAVHNSSSRDFGPRRDRREFAWIGVVSWTEAATSSARGPYVFKERTPAATVRCAKRRPWLSVQKDCQKRQQRRRASAHGLLARPTVTSGAGPSCALSIPTTRMPSFPPLTPGKDTKHRSGRTLGASFHQRRLVLGAVSGPSLYAHPGVSRSTRVHGPSGGTGSRSH